MPASFSPLAVVGLVHARVILLGFRYRNANIDTTHARAQVAAGLVIAERCRLAGCARATTKPRFSGKIRQNHPEIGHFVPEIREVTYKPPTTYIYSRVLTIVEGSSSRYPRITPLP